MITTVIHTPKGRKWKLSEYGSIARNVIDIAGLKT